ncbi:MAG: UDP-galactopyranose mutase [Bacillota bacterium]|nr:UDP-galactopyranose mutase [Bacillota bacterium]
MKVDWLIIGAGFAGVTLAERIATQLGQKVLVVEKRDHVGGNAYDEYDEHGVLVHRYGPHIFHTNLKHVWDYLSYFTRWRPYYHRVLAVVDGKKVPVPFNLNSLYALFPPGQAARLEAALIDEYGFRARVPILRLRESEKRDLRFLADYIYEKIFYGYTLKQWGLKPEELDPSVTGRVPVYVSRDDRYFRDRYQAMPVPGYNQLFRLMLAHPNIKVLLNTDYREIENEVKFSRMVYTGPIDAFFDYVHGKLPYRSLRFEFAILEREWFQEVGTVNYPNEFDFTRITEFKHLTGQVLPQTAVVYEYPTDEGDPCYPVLSDETRELYYRYESEARKLKGVYFVGRLAEYRYYNMDEAVARALEVFEEIIRGTEE